MVIRANNLPQKSWELSPPEKMGPKTFYICSVFRRFRDLVANTLWKKRDVDNRARALESTRGLPSQNFMNFGPQMA